MGVLHDYDNDDADVTQKGRPEFIALGLKTNSVPPLAHSPSCEQVGQVPQKLAEKLSLNPPSFHESYM